MEVKKLEIEGLILIKVDIYEDERGFFTDRFHSQKFAQLGLPTNFVQDNHSRSKPGVLRGLHYQHSPGQGKLVGVPRGRILDVAVDIRVGSPSFGKSATVELSDSNGLLLWIPGGFAHGFCVLGDEPADVFYKVDTHYNPKTEGGIKFDDEAFGIKWPLSNPIVSGRDRQLPTFEEYKKNPVFKYREQK